MQIRRSKIPDCRDPAGNQRIADALGISIFAISDPNLESYEGVLHALFYLEDEYGIEISDEEAAALVADGYIKVNWGADLVSNRDEYEKYLFYDFSGTKAPIYLWPFTPNVMTTGGFTNGYGFKQE